MPHQTTSSHLSSSPEVALCRCGTSAYIPLGNKPLHTAGYYVKTPPGRTLVSIKHSPVSPLDKMAVVFSLHFPSFSVLAECMCSVTPRLTLSCTHSHLADAQNRQSFTIGHFTALQAEFWGWSVMFRLISTVAAGGSASHSRFCNLPRVYEATERALGYYRWEI